MLKNSVRLKALITGLCLTVLFLILSLMVGQDRFRGLDYNLMLYLQSLFGSNFDKPLSYFTLFGSSELSFIAIGLIFIIVLIKKKHVFLGLTLFFIIYIIELMGKFLIFHPKPPPIFNRYALDFHFPSSFIVNTVSSFPSGHMARSAFISIIILFIVLWHNNKLSLKIFHTLLIILFIAGMFISRIFLGEHWFSDVAGGMIIGFAVGFYTIALW